MFIDVRLLHYKERSFTYLVPDTLQSQIKPGILVKVPLQSRIVPAIVHSVTYNKKYNFEIKPIVAIYAFPDDKKYDGFIALGCVIKGETPHFDFICSSWRCC